MGRKLRYLPEGDHLVEVTCRIIHRRFLLRPSPKLNALIVGALARFQKSHDIKICGFVYLSNHCHLLLRPKSAEQLANFMRDVNSKIAKEVGRLHGWKEKVWGRRYTDIVTSHEPEAQILRLRYLLEQGSKEGLVASPKHWPGASSTRALLSGEALEGLWIDRSAQYRAWERKESNPDELFTTLHQLELSPLPCWDTLESHECQAKVRAVVREIEQATEGVDVLGRKAICEQDPLAQPTSHARRSPAPRFHALEPRVRRALEYSYRLMRRAYRQASDEWRSGKTGHFPDGCFVPGRYLPLRT